MLFRSFSLYSSIPSPQGIFFSFILSSFFHLLPSRVDQVSEVDSCPIRTFLKSLVVAVRLKIIVQVSLPH